MSNTGIIYGVNGPVIYLKGDSGFKISEMVYVGKENLVGEVIGLKKGMTTVQVFEETTGLRPGETVTGTGDAISVLLGPGIIHNIFDGIQRPLEEIVRMTGPNLQRGVEVPERALPVAEFTVDSGYEQAERLLDEYPELDAIVCATDSIAYGALTCLREYGRSVPGDVQVTGVGDAEISQIVTPTLTTVHHHYKTSGSEAAKMLVGLMTGESVPREVKMGYEVVARNSTR